MNLDTRVYMKKRKDFGRQPLFCEVVPHIIDSIISDPIEQKHYILRNPVHEASQVSTIQSEQYVNTINITLEDTGINHVEGGWPKEVNYLDEESVARHRRRIERDDSYVDAVLNATPKILHYCKQNNAIELYEMYFKDMRPQLPVEKSSIVIQNIFHEQTKRPVSAIAWTIEDQPKLVVSHGDRKYPIPTRPIKLYHTFNVWNIENPNIPMEILDPPSDCWTVACSPINPNLIVSGLDDGRVAVFDIRANNKPIDFTPEHLAHRDPINSLLYTSSRTSTEFFTGSADGTCKWWDLRNLSSVTETLIMTIKVPPGAQAHQGYAESVSCLQFDRSFPTRFFCGTDSGVVINVNRRGKSISEVMAGTFHAHRGAVKAVHRSPLTSKMFLTCGDWTVHIWSDELHTSPIVTGLPHRYAITDAAWAALRVSGFMYISTDGKFRYIDLLRRYREPVCCATISKFPLLRLSPHDEGRLVAIGDARGSTILLNLSENLVYPGEKDKQIMLQTFERENRREHILEARIREIKLRIKTEQETVAMPIDVVEDESATDKQTEDDYRKVVINEWRKIGNITPNNEKKGKTRF